MQLTSLEIHSFKSFVNSNIYFLSMFKNIYIAILMGISLSAAFAQPDLNYTEVQLPHKLKLIRTMRYTTEDTTQSTGLLAYEATFDTAGKMTRQFRLVIGDMIPYQYKTTFRYDAAGNLITKTDSQQMRPLTAEDTATLQSLGSDVIHHQYLYRYDQANRKVQELEFQISSKYPPRIPPLPDIKREYFYNQQGQLEREAVSHPVAQQRDQDAAFGMMICPQSVIRYEYDAAGHKIRESTRCNDDPGHDQHITTYHYDAEGMLKESVFDQKTVYQNNHSRKVYDSHGNEVQRYKTEGNTETLFASNTRVYDAQDRLTEDRMEYIYGPGQSFSVATLYSYFSNNLIYEQLIKSDETVTNYLTTYEFYPD